MLQNNHNINISNETLLKSKKDLTGIRAASDARVSTLIGGSRTMNELMIKVKVLNYCANAYLASTSETAKNPLCVENLECP